MIIGESFEKFMTVYWNDMATEIYDDNLISSVNYFVEIEGRREAINLLKDLKNLNTQEAFMETINFRKNPLKKYDFHRVITKSQASDIATHLESLL